MSFSRRQSLAAFALVALLVAACAQSPSARPDFLEDVSSFRIIPMSQWGGVPAEPGKGRAHAVTRITLHHGGTAFARGTDVPQHLRNLQSWSRREKGWADIPYHYVIDLDGVVYEARDIRLAGDTNTEYDPAGHALIMVLGNYEDMVPTAQQLDAIADAMAMLARRHGLGVEAIASHRDYSRQTVCPGKHLYRTLQDGSLVEAVKMRLRAR